MKRIVCAVCLLAVLLLPAAAPGEVFFLPSETSVIEAEAFAGDASIDAFIAPENLLMIGDRAFSGCAGLDIAEIPALTELGKDVFAGCGVSLLVRTSYGSPAHLYARDNGLDYQADTQYRALLIGNWNYPGYANDLIGPRYDVQNMTEGLSGLPGTPWTCTTRMNLGADAIPAAITSCFSGATDADVSLVYYSGHGGMTSRGSCLVGTDNYACYASDLRRALDQIPGRKIVIIDACNSGGLITGEVVTADSAEDGAGEDYTPADFVGGFLSTFRRQSRSGSLAGSLYFVMAACAADQYSWEFGDDSDRSFGLFTGSLLSGIGYEVPGYAWSAAHPADVNGDGAVSFREAFDYAYAETRETTQSLIDQGDPDMTLQTAACYPAACDWFAPFRFR